MKSADYNIHSQTKEVIIDAGEIEYLKIADSNGVIGERLDAYIKVKGLEGWEFFLLEMRCPWFKREKTDQ
jgi:hypothetical protein